MKLEQEIKNEIMRLQEERKTEAETERYKEILAEKISSLKWVLGP